MISNTERPAVQQTISEAGAFSSARWLAYFEDNKRARVNISFPDDLEVSNALREPLLRSLQKFQIGEAGEGHFLKNFARRVSDLSYEQCIDMFIKEEQFHARVLAEMIGALDGTLLTWHWSNVAFIVLRRMLGLKTELFILLIAEVIGKCFYRRCADILDCDLLSDAFSLIVLDEIAHLEFHSAFLRSRLEALPYWFRQAIYRVWAVLFYVACLVFIADHGSTLRQLNCASRDFLRECRATFHRCAMVSLGLVNRGGELT